MASSSEGKCWLDAKSAEVKDRRKCGPSDLTNGRRLGWVECNEFMK